jgi:hypothetical protein
MVPFSWDSEVSAGTKLDCFIKNKLLSACVCVGGYSYFAISKEGIVYTA